MSADQSDPGFVKRDAIIDNALFERKMERQLYGRWEPAEPYMAALEIWREYYKSTDAYDAFICSCKNVMGEAVPTNEREWGMINRYAKGQALKADSERRRKNIDDEVWFQAKRDALRETP